MPHPGVRGVPYDGDMTWYRSVAGVVLAVFLGLSPASAQQDPKADAARIFDEVMSPFCPGLTLADCPSPQAFELRDQIATRLAAGEQPDAVVSDLVARYGVRILADPSNTRVGAVAWGTPIVVAVFGALALAAFVRRSVRHSLHAKAPSYAANPELDRLLDEQLHALD
jgi:cytochrome c-type biogenesis protein CcmH/NrfF